MWEFIDRSNYFGWNITRSSTSSLVGSVMKVHQCMKSCRSKRCHPFQNLQKLQPDTALPNWTKLAASVIHKDVGKIAAGHMFTQAVKIRPLEPAASPYFSSLESFDVLMHALGIKSCWFSKDHRSSSEEFPLLCLCWSTGYQRLTSLSAQLPWRALSPQHISRQDGQHPPAHCKTNHAVWYFCIAIWKPYCWTGKLQ